MPLRNNYQFVLRCISFHFANSGQRGDVTTCLDTTCMRSENRSDLFIHVPFHLESRDPGVAVGRCTRGIQLERRGCRLPVPLASCRAEMQFISVVQSAECIGGERSRIGDRWAADRSAALQAAGHLPTVQQTVAVKPVCLACFVTTTVLYGRHAAYRAAQCESNPSSGA